MKMSFVIPKQTHKSDVHYERAKKQVKFSCYRLKECTAYGTMCVVVLFCMVKYMCGWHLSEGGMRLRRMNLLDAWRT